MRASVSFLVKKKRGASPCHGPVYVFRFGYSSSYQCYFFKGNNRIYYAYKHVWVESICRNISFKFRMIISGGLSENNFTDTALLIPGSDVWKQKAEEVKFVIYRALTTLINDNNVGLKHWKIDKLTKILKDHCCCFLVIKW